MCPFWQGKAVCKIPGCTKFNLCIMQEPGEDANRIVVNVGACHSKGLSFRRRTSRSEQDILKGKLREFTPCTFTIKNLAAGDEQKLIEGNTTEVPPLTVLQKNSSEKNFQNRMDTNPLLDCIKTQKAQSLCDKAYWRLV